MTRDKEYHHGKILSAATEEFLKYGFMDASMRRIASAAGMSASGLYKHFASKEEMFSALVEPACQGLITLYRQEEECQEKLQVVYLPETVRQLVSVVAYLCDGAVAVIIHP